MFYIKNKGDYSIFTRKYATEKKFSFGKNDIFYTYLSQYTSENKNYGLIRINVKLSTAEKDSFTKNFKKILMELNLFFYNFKITIVFKTSKFILKSYLILKFNNI